MKYAQKNLSMESMQNEAASEQIPNATTAESFHEDGVTSRRGSMLLETFEKINAQVKIYSC